MTTVLFATLSLITAATLTAAAQTPQASSGGAGRPGIAVRSFYDLKTETLLGKPADLGSYRGKVTLVVNVASKCGYTPQNDGLEEPITDLQVPREHGQPAGREFQPVPRRQERQRDRLLPERRDAGRA